MARPLPEKKQPSKMSSLKRAGAAFAAFHPASSVLRKVRSVPTIFPQFDHATRVGGLPIERFSLIHGPSNQGKTVFTIGLLGSFLRGDHYANLVDAERTTPITWLEELIGDLAHHERFFAERPDTYESTMLSVRKFLTTLGKLRADGTLPVETAGLVVVDSLKKLMPANLMEEILKAEVDETSAGQDRAGQLRAKMNAAWMDELVPLLEHAGAACVAIAREMEDPDANQFARKFGSNYKVGGGGAIFFDSSLVMRVDRAGWVTKGESEEDRKIVYGERHRVTIRKTKVAAKEGRQSVAYFHTSNGAFTPLGFDRPRDVLELAERFGVVEKSGAWYAFDGVRLGQGKNNVVLNLHGDLALCARIEDEVRGRFVAQEPFEHDADGVIA